MTDIVRHEAAPLAQQIELAKTLAPSMLLPKEYQQNPANLLFALQYADALDVKPIHAITSIHVINGKPSASAELIASVVRRAGHKLRVTADDREATATLIRADDQGFEYTVTWDLERAKAAGITGNPTWKKFPAAMLRSRAITEVCRMGASDALYGVTHTPDELGGEFADEPTGAPAKSSGPTAKVSRKPKAKPEPEVVDAEILPDTHGQDELREAIRNTPETGEAPSEAQTKKMFASLRDLGLTERDDILEYVGNLLGREVASSKDLTRAEVGTIIDSLEGNTNA